MLGEDQEFVSMLVKILSRDDYLYDAAQRLLLCVVSSSRMENTSRSYIAGQEMTEPDVQRLNRVRELVACIAQHWLLSEVRETEINSHYIRNIEILRCLLQNGEDQCTAPSSQR